MYGGTIKMFIRQSENRSRCRFMSAPSHLAGCILTPEGWVRGRIAFVDTVVAIEGFPDAPASREECIVLPGFVDLHVHGGGGRDVMDGRGAVDTIATVHAQHGTTSLLATTMTAPRDDLNSALKDVARAMSDRQPGQARILGVHLEGPFISPDRLGAQPRCIRSATTEEFNALNALAPIRVLTLAPEMAGHLDFIRYLRSVGVVPQIGHSNGSYEEGVAALEAGAGGFTHLFNAMSALHHRHPGMTGAALAHAEFAEIIPDLLHVHQGAIHAARRAIPRLYCVTDATSATGMPDGHYPLGSQTVHKCLGGVRLADGTLAGSVLTMDQALRNLVSIGIPLHQAALHVSTYPADYLGETRIGRLRPGALADFVILDAQLEVKQVYVGGRPCLTESASL